MGMEKNLMERSRPGLSHQMPASRDLCGECFHAPHRHPESRPTQRFRAKNRLFSRDISTLHAHTVAFFMRIVK
jgi:hypothetical protein